MPRARQWRGYYLFLLGFVRHLERVAGLFHGDSLMFLPGTQTLSLGLSQLPAPFPEPPNPIGCQRGRLPSDIWSDFFWLAEFEYNGGGEAAGRWGRTGFFPSNKTPSTWWYRAPRTGESQRIAKTTWVPRLSPEQRQQHVIITQTGARSSKFQLHPLTESEPISAPEIILLILQHEFVAATCLTGGRPQGRPQTPSSGLGAPQIPQEGPEVSLRRRTSGVPAQPAATNISGG